MEPLTATLSEAPRLEPVPCARTRNEVRIERKARVWDEALARRIYALLAAVFGLIGFGLFLFFAYHTLGRTGVVLASGVTVGAAWAFIKFVLLC